MKARTTILLSCGLALILLVGCRQEAIQVNTNFTGNWVQPSNPIYHLEINIPEDGDATVTELVSGEAIQNKSGVARIDKKKDMLWVGGRSWHIDSYPAKASDSLYGAYWKVTLHDVELHRPQ